MKPSVPHLTETEAAEYLDAKPQTLRVWRHRGRGPAFLKPVGKIKYRLDDLDKFLAESRVVPGEAKRQARTTRKRRAEKGS